LTGHDLALRFARNADFPSVSLNQDAVLNLILIWYQRRQVRLSEMWWPEQQDGRKALPSKTEGELAKNVSPVRIAVALR
jgi:hypothetical protein